MELQTKEAALKEATENLQSAIEEAADKASTIVEAKMKAVKEFKAEVIEGSLAT